MKQYLDLCKEALNGDIREHRNGKTIGVFGAMMKFDMRDGFPLVTTKKLAWRSAFAEMLGFLRGYDNAKDFAELGTNVWNANAEADYWVNNPQCQGNGDLGRIYGVQARGWRSPSPYGFPLDQLKMVIDDLSKGIDNRREIVTHWNPGEMDEMALPPCHMMYQFHLRGNHLDMSMYQRSADLPLGVPFNIAGYAWLLHVIARITGTVPGVFTHMIGDAHVYWNQRELLEEQISRITRSLPTLLIDVNLSTLEDFENKRCTIDNSFRISGYEHDEPIQFPFSV